MKYFIITFGCQMNKSDSERIDYLLINNGYQRASQRKEADLIIVNMCSVRQSAVDRVYGLAPHFKKFRGQNPKLKTLLTGCILKKDEKNFRKLFDFILPIKSLKKWLPLLKKENYLSYLNQRGPSFIKKFGLEYFQVPPKPKKEFSVFVPISTGCDNFCSYCVVPYTRGPLICRPPQEILNEVESWVKKGVKEIWLLGQNVNDYSSKQQTDDKEKTINFPQLLELVNSIPGDFWIRFYSPNPKDFSDELIESMANCEKVTEYLNLPLQSGDNEILKKMNRPYSAENYKKLVEKIRGKIPHIAISTDIIVGFPGETREQFQNTTKLFKELKFDMAYIAEYSVRPGTKAAKMEDTVPAKEKERRRNVLTEALKKTALEKNRAFIGKKIKVLTMEKIKRKGKAFYIGKSRDYKTVKLEEGKIDNKNLLGKFAEVKIVDVIPWGLKGSLE